MLEIGCAEGAHLTPLALLSPESRFVGLDLESRAIERGNETIRAVGLRNLSLEFQVFATESGAKISTLDALSVGDEAPNQTPPREVTAASEACAPFTVVASIKSFLRLVEFGTSKITL